MIISFKEEWRGEYLFIESLVDGKHWDSGEIYKTDITPDRVSYYKYVCLCPGDHRNVLSASKYAESPDKEHLYSFEEVSDYQNWFKEFFFIDGEDASEFLREVQRTAQSRDAASWTGVSEGWKYYKLLRARGFNKSTSANLAFWRGYVDGMDWNNVWEKEGTEALEILGLRRI